MHVGEIGKALIKPQMTVVRFVVRSHNRRRQAFGESTAVYLFVCFFRQSASRKERRQVGCPKPEGQNDIGRFPPTVAYCAFWSDWLVQLELWLLPVSLPSLLLASCQMVSHRRSLRGFECKNACSYHNAGNLGDREAAHFEQLHLNSGSSGIALWPQISHWNQPSTRSSIMRNSFPTWQ